MTRLANIPAIAWAILAFAAWRSTELLNAWRHSPLDRLGWIAFLLWLTPVAASFAKPSLPGLHPAAPWFLGASLAASIFGVLADFNTAHYVGLSCAIAALGGWSWRHALWFAAAITWMPAFSWAGQDLPRPALIGARIVATSIACAPLLGFLVFTKPRPSLP